MGCVGSDAEDELRANTSLTSSKRFKFPKKCSDDDRVTVNYAVVPRKLRSAIKKKRCHVSDGLITKDEEEVAETLNALADMFPNIVETKTKTDEQLLETKSSDNVAIEEEIVTNMIIKDNVVVCEGLSGQNKEQSSQLLPGLSPSKTRDCDSDMHKTSLEKDGQVEDNSKNKRKRWPTNVYISRVIKKLQIIEKEKKIECTQSVFSRENKSTEIKNAILLHKRLLQEEQQAAYTTSQMQNIPFLLPQNCYSSAPFNNPAHQLNPYLGSMLRSDVTAPPKQQQIQQQNRTYQVASPAILTWQNGGHNGHYTPPLQQQQQQQQHLVRSEQQPFQLLYNKHF